MYIEQRAVAKKMRLHYDITLPWIRISDWTKVAKRNRWVRADVSVVIMTSQSFWIKCSNWKKVTQEECAAIMRSQFPLLLLLRSSGWSNFSQRMRTVLPGWFCASYVKALNDFKLESWC